MGFKGTDEVLFKLLGKDQTRLSAMGIYMNLF
jgi:hypothetical protein